MQDVTFNVSDFGHIQYTNAQSGVTVFIAPLAVKELLQMQGISNQVGVTQLSSAAWV
jgi:hypothetical protein